MDLTQKNHRCLPLLAALEDKFTVDDGCWEWVGYKRPTGYGGITRDGWSQLAHRVMYELFVGPIPEGLQIDHLCRNRACVRPDHLEPVTLAENVLRGVGRSAVNARKTHCQNGHELAGSNVGVCQGARHCVICRRAYKRAWRARRRAAGLKAD